MFFQIRATNTASFYPVFGTALQNAYMSARDTEKDIQQIVITDMHRDPPHQRIFTSGVASSGGI